MVENFRLFFDYFIEVWKNSSLKDIKEILSTDYQAREVTGGKIEDFGYEESLKGWAQAFEYFPAQGWEWILNEITIIPLRENEVMAVLYATFSVNGKISDNANLFFETFKQEGSGEWKLVRSYIEAGLPVEKLHTFIKQ